MRIIVLLCALLCLAPVVSSGQVVSPPKPNELIVNWSSTDGVSLAYGRAVLLGSTLITPSIIRPLGIPDPGRPQLGLVVERPIGRSFLLAGWYRTDLMDRQSYRAEVSWDRLLGLAVERRGMRQEGTVRIAFVNIIVDER